MNVMCLIYFFLFLFFTHPASRRWRTAGLLEFWSDHRFVRSLYWARFRSSIICIWLSLKGVFTERVPLSPPTPPPSCMKEVHPAPPPSHSLSISFSPTPIFVLCMCIPTPTFSQTLPYALFVLRKKLRTLPRSSCWRSLTPTRRTA